MYTDRIMERGTVALTNIELGVLHDLAIAQGCKKQDLIDKLSPVANVQDQAEEHSVLMSEEEAEIILDCMPMPSPELDSNLISARIKVQQFLAKSRFGDQS